MTIKAGDPRRTEYLPLDDLIADPKNPKAHDTDVLDASVARFGFVESITRDDRTGYMISGHGRAETLKMMFARGESPPEGVKIEDGRWLVPVTVGWASRTDYEAQAALIALNRTVELGGWVDDALIKALDDLAELDAGLLGVGFDTDDLASLHDLLEDTAGGAPKPPPEFPEYGDGIAVEYQCPSCGYEWSGSPSPGHSGGAQDSGDDEI